MNSIIIGIQWIVLLWSLKKWIDTYGEQVYVSKFYYDLKDKETDKDGNKIKKGNQWQFAVFMIVLGGGIISIGNTSYVYGHKIPLWQISGSLLIGVGMWPLYRKKYDQVLHVISAWGSGIFGFAAVFFDPRYIEIFGESLIIRFVPVILFGLICLFIKLKNKFIVERIEIAIFVEVMLLFTILNYQ